MIYFRDIGHAMTDIEISELIYIAILSRNNAYAPYSNYTVGAALRLSDGTIVTGSNIENASYGATICAERTAIFKAVSEGRHDFCAIAIAGSPQNEPVSQYAFPCGICRQVMREFTTPDSFEIYVAGPDGAYKAMTLEELLPYGFGPENLD